MIRLYRCFFLFFYAHLFVCGIERAKETITNDGSQFRIQASSAEFISSPLRNLMKNGVITSTFLCLFASLLSTKLVLYYTWLVRINIK